MSNFYSRLLISILIGPIILAAIYIGGLPFAIILILLFFFGLKEILFLKSIKIKIIIFVLFIIFLLSITNIRFSNNGLDKIFFCLFLTWLSDIGGYFFGKIIGGKKINIISPNKTYSGFLGSLILPQTLFFYLINKNIIIVDKLYYYFFFIFVLSVMSIVGDLLFSYFKRLMKIKDYSKLLLGHGGIFDRIDGLIFVIIFFLLLSNL